MKTVDTILGGAKLGNQNAAGPHTVNGIALEKNLAAPHEPEKGVYSWHGGREIGSMKRREIVIRPDFSPSSGKHNGRWYAEVANPNGSFNYSGSKLSIDSAKEAAASMHKKAWSSVKATDRTPVNATEAPTKATNLKFILTSANQPTKVPPSMKSVIDILGEPKVSRLDTILGRRGAKPYVMAGRGAKMGNKAAASQERQADVAASGHEDHDAATITARATSDLIYCRAATSLNTASEQPWKQGQETSFMYMPAGLHTICAGFRGKSILLTVDVDPERDTQTVQASLNKLTVRYPKQKPFGCIEHEEKDASVWAKRFEAQADGIYLAAEPSALGESHVNGRIHRSWSPSFLTDADYSKAKLANDIYEFPDGVRGSENNPAQITGIAFCVGTLTNNPAFKEMNPVRARDAALAMSRAQAGDDGTVQATESQATRSEAPKKGWEGRAKLSHQAFSASADAIEIPTVHNHMNAYRAHTLAAEGHKGEDDNSAKQHSAMADRHLKVAKGLADEASMHADNASKSAESERRGTTMHKSLHWSAREAHEDALHQHQLVGNEEKASYHRQKMAGHSEKLMASGVSEADLVTASRGAQPGNKNANGPHKMKQGGELMPSGSGHNVLAVTESGSPVSTQVWNGGHAAAAKTLLDWHAAGEAGRSKEHSWDQPVVHGYINSHEHGTTHHYDLTNPKHIESLKRMAQSATTSGGTFATHGSDRSTISVAAKPDGSTATTILARLSKTGRPTPAKPTADKGQQ